MNRAYGFALGAAGLVGLGAGLMFFLDSKNGRRRRMFVRDQVRHGYDATTDTVTRMTSHCANQARGVAARISEPFRPTPIADDDVLLARVRSRIGHVVPDPAAIEVKADHGCVSLSGRLDYQDARKLLKTVASTRGVAAVDNHLAMQLTH